MAGQPPLYREDPITALNRRLTEFITAAGTLQNVSVTLSGLNNNIQKLNTNTEKLLMAINKFTEMVEKIQK